MDHPKPASLTCLLCGSADLREIAAWTGKEARAYYGEFGHRLSLEDVAPMTDETRIVLHECAGCGFRFFDPRFAGSARFYAAIDSGDYYPGHRNEFDFALAEVRRRGVRRILDIGGGDGAFLDAAAQAGLKTYGLEINTQAAERSAAKGHRMLVKSLETLTPEDTGGGFEAVTLFQVVEHVPDPIGFLRLVRTVVADAGWVVIAVPYEHGVRALCPDDPMNLPPHHVSRWRPADLRRLAVGAGFRCVRQETEPLYGSLIEFYNGLQHRLAKVTGKPAPRLTPGLARALSFLYRKSGARHYLPAQGMNVMAVLEK